MLHSSIAYICYVSFTEIGALFQTHTTHRQHQDGRWDLREVDQPHELCQCQGWGRGGGGRWRGKIPGVPKKIAYRYVGLSPWEAFFLGHPVHKDSMGR